MESLKEVPVPDLLARLEKDIRFGCHSVRAETGRSFAGKELRTRGDAATQAVTERLEVLKQKSNKNALQIRIEEGLKLLLRWMANEAVEAALSNEVGC